MLRPMLPCGMMEATIDKGRKMEGAEKKLKVYCETSFWSYLTGRPTPLAHIALKQASSLAWWESESPKCDICISEHVLKEAMDGDIEKSKERLAAFAGCNMLDGSTAEVDALAKALLQAHAVPIDEVTDAYHIATAAVYGMDVLLTWNCRHMANRFALPKTIAVVSGAGYACPAIVTPDDYIKEDLDA